MMMARVAAAGLLLGLLAAPAFAAESYEAKEAYDHHHAPAPHAKKAYGHRHSIESVCLQEVEDSCDLGFAINLDICDPLALRYYSNLECCKPLAGVPAQIANSRSHHAAQMLKLFKNTDACRWDFTFGVDILNLILDPEVSGIDSPGVLPFGKAVGTCYFSDALHKCGPFCDNMELKVEADMFLTWGVSADGDPGCILDQFFPRAQQRLAADKADRSADRAVDFVEKLQAAAKAMADKGPATGARRAELAADKKPAVESYEREYVDPPAHSYKSHHYDPLSGGALADPTLTAGIFAMFTGSFTGSVNGVKDEELAGDFSFTPLFIPVLKYNNINDINKYLGLYPGLPYSRAGQFNFWFAREEEERAY